MHFPLISTSSVRTITALQLSTGMNKVLMGKLFSDTHAHTHFSLFTTLERPNPSAGDDILLHDVTYGGGGEKKRMDASCNCFMPTLKRQCF